MQSLTLYPYSLDLICDLNREEDRASSLFPVVAQPASVSTTVCRVLKWPTERRLFTHRPSLVQSLTLPLSVISES